MDQNRRHAAAACCAALVLVLAAAAARADQVRGDDDTWRVRSTGLLTVDGGLLLATPAALQNGLSTGLGAGVTYGRTLAWGVRASWSSATESSLDWTVTQADLKARATGAVQGAAGRGRFALRLGLGATVVDETRVRNQGMRAGLTGSALTTHAFTTLPAADLDGVVALHVAGRWLVTLSAGPSATLRDRRPRLGWVAQLGTGWQR